MTDFDYLGLEPLAYPADAPLPSATRGQVYILVEGTAMLRVTTPGGASAPCLLHPGDVWGLGSEPPVSTVLALTPCQVLMVDKFHRLHLEANDPRFNQALVASLTTRLARMTNRLGAKPPGKDSVLEALFEFARVIGEPNERGWLLPNLSREVLRLYARVSYGRAVILLGEMEEEGKLIRGLNKDVILVADSTRQNNLLGEPLCPSSFSPTLTSGSTDPLTRPRIRAAG